MRTSMKKIKSLTIKISKKKNKDNKGKKNEETKSDAGKNNNERLSYNPFANLNFKLPN